MAELDSLHSDSTPATENPDVDDNLEDRFHISQDEKNCLYLSDWLKEHEDDPAFKVCGTNFC